MSLPYALREVHERFGQVELTLATLADLDQVVSALCADYVRRGADDELARDLCPYFGAIWPAARGLAREVARRAHELAGRRVIELGCGLALPSLVAAKAGARVLATDLHPDVPGFLALNLAHNGLTETDVAYRELDWRAGALGSEFDWVLASDVLYEAAHPQAVARALAAHVAPDGHILLADPGRAYLQACLDELGVLGFRHTLAVERVADQALDRAGDRQTREVFVIDLARA
jgi:predicted nicotinamide N-methyase